MIEFRLPDIGEGLHEAEVVSWFVAVGDRIERDQPFVEILTDKSAVEMPAPGSGTVVSLGANPGDMVNVGDVLIVIDDGGAAVPNLTESAVADAPEVAAPSTPLAPTVAPASATSGRRPKAAPATRKLAAELGVDLHSVSGTGPGGRILADDVRAATERTAPASAALGAVAPPPIRTDIGVPATLTRPPAASSLGQAEPGVQPLRGIRRATAKAMDASWSTIPHVHAFKEIDATELLEVRGRIRDALGDAGASITPLSLMMMAVARALRAYPLVNASLDLDADTITVHADVNIGVAVASERGLIVPVVKQADRLGVVEMAAEIARLSGAARDGSVSPVDLADGTFTVTNYGANGGWLAAPLIRPGEAGIIGFGRSEERPWVVDGAVVARPVLPVVIAGDHRLIDGDLLSAFHEHVCASLRQAIGLLL